MSTIETVIGKPCGVGVPPCGKPAEGWCEGPNGENRIPICRYHVNMLKMAEVMSGRK